MQFLLRFVLWVSYGVLKHDLVQNTDINTSIIAKYSINENVDDCYHYAHTN